MTEELLDSVPQKYLDGLKTIILTNRAALSRKQRQQKLWSRNRKVALADYLGTYQVAIGRRMPWSGFMWITF